MTSIPFSSIIFGDRGRKEYHGVDELAESIEQNGLVQPLVLVPEVIPMQQGDTFVPCYKLVAGGRRYHALQLLGITELFHGVTCERNPLRCGYLLKGESDPLSNLLQEIAENRDRQDLDWRDEVALLVKTWRLAKAQADVDSEPLIMRHYGSMLGVGYANLQAAVFIHEDVTTNPERYKDCTSLRGAQSILLKVNANAVAKLVAEKSMTEVPVLSTTATPLPEVSAQFEPRLDPIIGELTQSVATVGPGVIHPTIPLSQAFLNVNAIDFMEQCAPALFDHIITDPDYAIDAERLTAASEKNAGSQLSSGIAQKTSSQSLAELERFIQLAFHITKDHSFLAMFYDIEHHEKIVAMGLAAGWRVQRWPLTWRKLDYRSNAAPSHNTCKNEEWCMLMRKPGAILAKVQMSSVYDTATNRPGFSITKTLGHPFAKPFDLWKWIFQMVSIEGQTIFDPFAGSGSCPIAALQYKLRPVGCEVNPDHYNNLMCNLQIHYKKELGPDIIFS